MELMFVNVKNIASHFLVLGVSEEKHPGVQTTNSSGWNVV